MTLLDILSFSSVITSVLVITAGSPVVSVLFLIALFVEVACYLMFLGLGFVGLVYLVVYVGAVAVLFLFVVMMLNVSQAEINSAGREYTQALPLVGILGILFLIEVSQLAPSFNTESGNIPSLDSTLLNTVNLESNVNIAFTALSSDTSFNSLSQVQTLAFSLYTYDMFSLILVSVLLLLAMVGPVSLSMQTHIPLRS